MRRAAKIDKNQTEIVEAMRKTGATVIPTHRLKNAFDCLACYRGKIFIIEIKNPEYLPETYDRERLEKSLSKGELKCMNDIEKTGVKYHIICTIDEAIKLITE